MLRIPVINQQYTEYSIVKPTDTRTRITKTHFSFFPFHKWHPHSWFFFYFSLPLSFFFYFSGSPMTLPKPRRTFFPQFYFHSYLKYLPARTRSKTTREFRHRFIFVLAASRFNPVAKSATKRTPTFCLSRRSPLRIHSSLHSFTR